ncbi:hypothetical protein Zmor_006028 [Zophobas morio]|uniref:Protein takeout n=1 Tax=Zophobas morio TaxID=2755281 RepID=A0AA38ML19_9CUCU|nr:hypothetical protein Zmor_006028 [Zophobas morio]
MKQTTTIILVVLSTLHQYQSAKLPTNFKKCDKGKPDFDKCLSSAIQDAIKHLNKPLAEYGLVSLDPYVTPNERKIVFGDEITGLRQKFSKFKMSGFTDIENTDARMDFPHKILYLDLVVPKLVCSFEYEAHGRMVLVPVDVVTPAAATLNSTSFKMTFPLQEFKQGNDIHYKVTGSKMIFIPTSVHYDFKKIVGNEDVDKGLNALMDKNWLNIAMFWQRLFPGMLVRGFEKLFNNLLEKVPVVDLFDGL